MSIDDSDVNDAGDSAAFVNALALVRGLWSQPDIPESVIAWAMMIEAVDRLTALHGRARMGRLLEGLVREMYGPPSPRVLQ
ncbi:hypothetical protein [Azospirillum sp. TSO35-2]|uniref:hypothetical protein n=1 Tax=Azospirillum sp. TSO35-2 TaxID=716796 RepID=UPI000D618EEE|nr:hypothetical protein [Azospirillum sp. TSO35-2]PWC39415.1 hypothetical protein TSO352_04465 [Azospirillum sp. TSO35-2]